MLEEGSVSVGRLWEGSVSAGRLWEGSVSGPRAERLWEARVLAKPSGACDDEDSCFWSVQAGPALTREMPITHEHSFLPTAV
jgi:hypothetical protein